MSVQSIAAPQARTFFGHPLGLAYLSFTETWERFSFYGMQALLLLYMVDRALTPAHAGDVLGLAGFKGGLEAVFGPLSMEALASQIFGLYTGLVYFTPLFGGLLGDRVLGQRRTVMLGAVLMAIGHLLMAFDATLLVALAFLVVGCGCLKGNISAQVGQLYARGDDRRSHAFSVFNVEINIGVFAAPLVCGTLGETLGWAWGFGAAAVGMVVGLVIYVAGAKYLPPDTVRRHGSREPRQKLKVGEGRVVLALTAMLALGILFNIAYGQETNVFSLWARDTLDRRIFGWIMPVTWFQALDGAFVIGFTPVVLRLWAAQAARGREPSDLGKIALGSVLGMLGMGVLALASLLFARGIAVGPWWGVACFALFGAGFIYQWPTSLALVSRAAPASINSTMMGVAFFSAFIANYLVGWLGGFYEKMTPTNFWLMHAAISGAGAVLTWVCLRPLNRVLLPEHALPDDETLAAESLAETT